MALSLSQVSRKVIGLFGGENNFNGRANMRTMLWHYNSAWPCFEESYFHSPQPQASRCCDESSPVMDAFHVALT